MCVIAIKKVGVDVPNEQNIIDMWESNSDGAGFMYAIKNKVYIEKGFMKLEDFKNSLKILEKRIKKMDNLTLKDIPMVYHFRIKTHGANNPANTHPFPISANEQHLKALDLTTPLAMVHNGIISSAKPMGDMSDTASYIANVLTPLAKLDHEFYKKPYGIELMENTIGLSKLAFLDKDGEIVLVGHFLKGTQKGTENILYSNLSHETPIFSSAPYYTKAYNDYKFDYDSEMLKPVPKDYYIGYYNDTREYKTFLVEKDNTYFLDNDNFIYAKSQHTNTYTHISKFDAVYIDNGKEFLDEITYLKLDTIAFMGETNYSPSKWGY